jgi:hypothetical protein
MASLREGSADCRKIGHNSPPVPIEVCGHWIDTRLRHNSGVSGHVRKKPDKVSGARSDVPDLNTSVTVIDGKQRPH